MSGWGRRHIYHDQARPWVIVAGPDGRRVNRSTFKNVPTDLAITVAVRRASLEEGGPILPVEAWCVNIVTDAEAPRIVVEEPKHWGAMHDRAEATGEWCWPRKEKQNG